MEDNNVSACAKLLLDKQLTIAFAESATAGRVMADFSLPEKAGNYLKGGLGCYDACIKQDLLNVPAALVEKYTPESEQVTEAMATGLATLIEADIHVGITGLTTSGGSETPEKPVGTMFIHANLKGKTLFKSRIVFEGTPEEIVIKTVNHTAKMLCDHLS